MKLSIISLNFQKPQLTLGSMQSLNNQYRKQFNSNEFEYIVVDNNSSDNSVQILEKEVKKYKNFHLVKNSVNSGFGAGCNLGAKHAKGSFVLFLNNDTEIKDDILEKMVDYFEEHPEIGILGGELRNFNGSSQVSTGKFFNLFSLFLYLLGMQRFGLIDNNPNKISKVDWVKGALLMIKKDLFEKLSGFDERIFMYTEDMELCYRVNKLGLPIYFYPTSGAYHQDQGSSNRTFAVLNIYKGLLYFYKKHKSGLEYILVKLMLKTKAEVLFWLGKMYNKEYLVKTYGQALEIFR